MREYVILACLISVAGCSGHRGPAQDSARADTSIVSGPPAVAPIPPVPAVDSASRPQAAPSLSKTSDARKSPGVHPTAASLENRPKPSTGALVTPGPTIATDTVRGIISVNGTDRDRHVMVAPLGGGRHVEVTGPVAPLVGHLAGADVWVAGTQSGTSLQAARFMVRTVDGMPALDGTLKTEGGALYIITDGGGRNRIVTPPPPLVGRDGARVWITGDPAKGSGIVWL